MNSESPDKHKIEYRFGIWTSAVPLMTFLIFTIVLVFLGAPEVEGMIIGAMAGLSLGMLLTKSFYNFSERIFSLMANRTATVAIVCWLWAGAFAGILKDSGLVEATVWLGWNAGLSGQLFTVAVFILAAVFAVSVGTGLGTVIGFTPIMYPAGIVLGADPAVLMGAIFSGAAFGDNLAPISDTTIVSATTQETDVGGVVKSRLKYCLTAAGIACVLFFIFGGGKSTVDPETAQQLLEKTANPKGLAMLVPAVIVFIVAVRGYHFLAALTAGIAAACIIGPLTGAFAFGDLIHVTADGGIEGSVVSGAMGLVPVGILTLLLITAIGLMNESGLLAAMMAWLDRTFGRTRRGAEASIVTLTSVANLSVSVNTVAMITVGPLVNQLRQRHGIHPHRSANLLDTISCSFPYVLPYAAHIPVAIAFHRTAHETYDFVPVLSWAQQAPYMFYCLTLFLVMIVSVITGFGSKRG
ncbi:MAG: Na+/H+ antiporter NhaC [Verrucomicrobiales bacterium]|jgi:Na+/H+ antiporter NhaC